MTRDAVLGARLGFVVLLGSLAVAFLLLLLGSPDGTGTEDIVRGAVLAAGAAFGGHGLARIGGAGLFATASPLLISLLPLATAWWVLRRASISLLWVAAVAVTAGVAMSGMLEWANGVHRVSVSAVGAGVGVGVIVGLLGGLARASVRWPVLGRPLDLMVGAAIGIALLGLATELVAGLTYSGHGAGGVASHTKIAAALAYAPNAGVAALALGLGGGLAVNGIDSAYSAFVARFTGDGPTAYFGASHGQSDWAQALHLPGLVSVFVFAPLLVLAVAYSARRLRSRGEFIAWALAVSVLFIGLGFLASVRLGLNYDGFELGGSLAPDWWGRLTGLIALPIGLAVFVWNRSAVEPGLDVGDGTREFSREVS